jgi:hypothetical protein
MSEQDRIRRLMQRVRRSGQLPTSENIVAETFQRLGYIPGFLPPDEVIGRFNELLHNLWQETLHTLEQYEYLAYSEGIPEELFDEYPEVVAAAEQTAADEGFRSGVRHLLKNWYSPLRRAFLSIAQSRMTRGGRDFELQIEGLLTLAGVSYHRQERQYRTDLILPNLETYQRNRTISAVVSVKRTLRERWREVAEELYSLRAPNVFLFTADDNATAQHVNQICHQHNIYLVVWDAEKTTKFPSEPLVLGYTEWASQRLSILKQHW